MNLELVIFAFVLLFFGFMGIFLVAMKNQNPKITSEKTKKQNHHFETSKVVIFLILLVWTLSALTGLWAVIFRDITLLENVQKDISDIAKLGVAAYTAKAGAENWKKSSVEEKNEEMKGEEDEYQ